MDAGEREAPRGVGDASFASAEREGKCRAASPRQRARFARCRNRRGSRLKTDPRCAACILAEANAAGLAIGGRTGAAVAAAGQGYVASILEPSLTPAVHLTRVHRPSLVNGQPPFLEARKRIREAARILVQHAERDIESAADASARLTLAARWSAAATHLDPRAAGLSAPLAEAEQLAEEVVRIATGAFAVDDSVTAFALLRQSRNVLFIHDGVGELSLDYLLIRELLRHCRRVFCAVSGAPLAGRATLDDLHRSGLAEIATEVMTIGPGEIGLIWEECSAEVKGKLEVADLIVVKGQANLYSLHEHEKEILKPMFCLFRTQCDPVAELFGSSGRVTVMKVWK